MRLVRSMAPMPIVGVLALSACAVNPATGKRELMLVSESQEIEIGKQSDTEAQAAYGTYPDKELEAYLTSLGKQIAAVSERTQLPWTFRVADDAAVNAFAIPGGYIHVTRGLLAHLDSEAELVMVVGHEVGHVTARHSAALISKQQLATLGLGIGMIAVPSLQRYGGIGQAGLGLLFLKFSRDDERQADDLGLRYLGRLGYEPVQGARTMEMLNRVSQQSSGGRLPGWLSTHPDPGDRYQRLLAQIQQQSLKGQKVNRDGYLRRLSGLTFGDDPREGFFRGETFYHSGLGFEMRMPRGYRGQNTKQAVLMASPQGDAVIQLTLAAGTSAEQASRTFVSQSNLQPGTFSRTQINGLSAVTGNFQATSEQTLVNGLAVFVEHQNRVFQLLGYTGANSWNQYGRTLSDAIGSFGPLRDQAAANAQPRRIELVTPDRAMTVAEFNRRYPSTVSEATVALINQVPSNGTLPAGRLAKRVVGGRGMPDQGAKGEAGTDPK